MQSDSSTCRRLTARHDKQYRGRWSAKCAAAAVRQLSLYSILESDSFLLYSALWSLCSYERSHLHTQMNTQTFTELLYACQDSWMPTHSLKHTSTHTHTHADRMKNACCKLSAALSIYPHYSLFSFHRPYFSVISHTQLEDVYNVALPS